MNNQPLPENRELLDYYHKRDSKPYVETFNHIKKQDLTRSPYAWAGIANFIEKRPFESMRDIQEEILEFSNRVKRITGKELIIKYDDRGYVIIAPADMETPLNIIQPYMILQIVCECLNLSTEKLLSKDRHQKSVDGREIIAFLLRKYMPKVSLKQIGKMLKRHHSSIIHEARSAAYKIETDIEFAEKVRACEARLFKM